MRNFFIFLFLGTCQLIAQPIELELKNFPVEIEGRGFYIKGVLDGRVDTSKIGWSLLNEEWRGRAYTLKGGLSRQLGHYLSTNLTNDSTQVPLVMSVCGLVISEKKKVMREGRATIQVVFMKEQEGLYGKVFETSFSTETVSEIGKDIYTTHERRIRFLLTGCLKKLQQSRWQEVKPDFISLEEALAEYRSKDSLSKSIQDSLRVFRNAKEEQMKVLTLEQIHYSKGLFPSYVQGDNKHGTLWPYKLHFAKLNNKEVNSLFLDYKAKFRLTFLTLGIGAALVGLSFMGESVQETGMPYLSLLVPGTVFMGCSVPIYFKTKKLGRNTVDKYNLAIESN